MIHYGEKILIGYNTPHGRILKYYLHLRRVKMNQLGQS